MPISSSAFPILSCSSFSLKPYIKIFDPSWIDSSTGERLGSSFILLQVDIQFSLHHLLKVLSFPQHILDSFVKIMSVAAWVSSQSFILIHWSLGLFFARTMLFFFLTSLKSSILIPQALLFFFSSWLHWLFKIFCASIWSLEMIFLSEKNVIGLLMGIALNIYILLYII
jgi:hypothetical protein